MKDIILDFNELTDSKEYYSTRPNPFINAFVYCLVALLIFAICFCSIKKIETTSTASGVVRPTGNVGTVTCLVGGTVKKSHLKDGQKVKKGDVLFTVDLGNSKSGKKAMEQSAAKMKEQIALLDKFSKGVRGGYNPFSKNGSEEEYTFYLQYQDYASTVSATQNQLKEMDDQIATAKKYRKSVSEGKDYVSDYPEYEKLYKNYANEYNGKVLPTTKAQYKKETLNSIDSSIAQMENQKKTAEANANASGGSALAKMKEEEAILSQKEQLKSQLDEVTMQLDQLDEQDNQGVVRANRSGTVNLMAAISEGDAISAGTTVATILPKEDAGYKVQLFLKNADVASVNVGDQIRYTLTAIPSSKYGNITGKITSIGKDTVIQGGKNTGYYLVEATIDKTTYEDKDGNKAHLRPGIQLEAKIVTQEKTIMHYFLEKVGLM